MATTPTPTTEFDLSGLIFPVFFVLIFGFIIVIFVFGYLQDKKRKEAIAQYARINGFSYQDTLDPFATSGTQRPFSVMGFNFGSLPTQAFPWMASELFGRGRLRALNKFMKKTTPTGDILFMDHAYVVRNGKNSTTYTQSIIIIGVPNPVPYFVLTPEGLFQKLIAAVGFKDINFDSNPEFSKKYCLKGANEAMIKQAFNSEVLRYFQLNSTFSHIESIGKYMLFCNPNKTIPNENIGNSIDTAIRIAAMFNQN